MEKQFSDEQFPCIFEDRTLKISIIGYLKMNPDRKFSRDLLEKVLSEKEQRTGIGDNVKYACFLLGLHRYIEDSLLAWRTKKVDFDAYCYMDIQLVVFADVDQTIRFFELMATEETDKAVEYLKQCKQTGDFKDIDE